MEIIIKRRIDPIIHHIDHLQLLIVYWEGFDKVIDKVEDVIIQEIN